MEVSPSPPPPPLFDETPVPDYPGLLRLDGRNFIVLGAGYGMGRQTAYALSQAGARVFCVDIEGERAKRVADEVGGIAWAADATDGEEAQALVAEARSAMGRIHGVVDVIGIARWGRIIGTSDEDWDWSHRMVARHGFNILRAAAPPMADDGGGCFTFVASISGISSAPNHGAYGAAKAALLSLVRTAAVELKEAKIRVNAVSPGSVATARIALRNNTTLDGLTARGYAAMSEIASALLFLSSDLASHVTGATLMVDGGAAVKYPFSPSAD
jgi:NAD(P)-dependent dehydrogenase (short-subunit alcohol dehydrogenase family)